jgi:HAE1 family hydrophobic/amphiphilic exporter-1
VEFAVQRRLEGVSLHEAAVEGARLRFRPIQMTSFAFIAGLIPLVMATGAGAIGNRTIGTTAAGGMLVGTIIGVLIIPGLYYLFGQLDGGKKLLKDETHSPLSEIPEAGGHHEPAP